MSGRSMPSSAVIALACLAVAQSSPAETLGVTTVALTQPPPITSPRHDLKIEYEAHVGGLAIGGVAVSATWNGERYAMTSHLITDGLAAKMFRAQFQNASHGLFKGRQVKPEQYSTNYQSITEQRQVKITFDETDTPIVDASPPYEEKYEVTEAQKRGAVDPMSSIMHFIVGSSATSNAPCGRAVPIYDGERRYDIKNQVQKRNRDNAEDRRYLSRTRLSMHHTVSRGRWFQAPLRPRQASSGNQDFRRQYRERPLSRTRTRQHRHRLRLSGGPRFTPRLRNGVLKPAYIHLRRHQVRTPLTTSTMARTDTRSLIHFHCS